MEALQLLKFSLKKERLNFMAGWATSEDAMGMVRKSRPSLADALFMCDAEHRDAMLDDLLNELDDADSWPYSYFLFFYSNRWRLLVRCWT
jgi:predicted transglutaminase-like cysteine proteinase